jgi:hypothetical protein
MEFNCGALIRIMMASRLFSKQGLARLHGILSVEHKHSVSEEQIEQAIKRFMITILPEEAIRKLIQK